MSSRSESCSTKSKPVGENGKLNEMALRKIILGGVALVLGLAFSGCGGGSAGTNNNTTELTDALSSNITIADTQAGVTPFISIVKLVGSDVSLVDSVTFTIAPKPASVSSPVKVTWSKTALSNRGDVRNTSLEVPVFGLYAGYSNDVKIQVEFNDQSVQSFDETITTQAWADPTGIYTEPTIVQARAPGSSLGFNYFIMKSLLLSPIIVDTDGEVRWVAPATPSQAAYYADGQFILGSTSSTQITAIDLDGTSSDLPLQLPQSSLTGFTHNIDPGPHGLLMEFDGKDDLGTSLEDIVVEASPNPNVPPFQVFDLADILTDYMKENGDDPTQFVRPGVDWFHINAATYDPNDNSVIVSSRENFLIKLDYLTHKIIWILGDPTKYWYTFPSLRAKALTLDAGGLYPIGQHAVSVTSDGNVMVFNDGQGSYNEPTGEPSGLTRTYSEVSVYSIDTSNMTAHEVWGFDYGKTVFSSFCGSVYESPRQSYLVDFATAAQFTQARLVGLDSNHNVVFDFQYNSPSYCSAAWNAIPIPLEDLKIDN